MEIKDLAMFEFFGSILGFLCEVEHRAPGSYDEGIAL
jgi:hypothetical protein